MNKINIILLVNLIILQFINFNQSFGESSSKELNTKPIAVIINAELYPQIKDSIDRYVVDLENEGYGKVFLVEWDNEVHPDVEELKTMLKSYHQDFEIQGAVLIGELPYAQGKVVMSDAPMPTEGPIETYLMDLKSTNFIKDANGNITTHKGNIHLDIWVSRIWAPKDGKLFSGVSEIDLLKDYFEKNHLYRTCELPVSDLKIKFYAEDKVDILTNIFSILEYFNSWKNFYYYLSESGCPSEYLEFVRNNPAQYLCQHAHSDIKSHSFKDDTYSLNSTDMISAQIKQIFIFLNACSACRFTDSQSLSHSYLFGPHSSALVIAGLAIPGNIMNVQFTHSKNNNFGKTVLSHYNGHIGHITYAFFSGLIVSIYENIDVNEKTKKAIDEALILLFDKLDKISIGFTLLGDPTLKPYVSMDWCPDYYSEASQKKLQANEDTPEAKAAQLAREESVKARVEERAILKREEAEEISMAVKEILRKAFEKKENL